jgi:hypothetical protein
MSNAQMIWFPGCFVQSPETIFFVSSSVESGTVINQYASQTGTPQNAA